MNKNYQMSDFMKAAIVNSLLTVVLINISFTIQYHHREDVFNNEMKRQAEHHRVLVEKMRQEQNIKQVSLSDLSRPAPKGPQPFYPNR